MNFLKSQDQLLNSLLFPGKYATSTYSVDTFRRNPMVKLLYIPFKRKSWTNFSYLHSAPTHIPVLLAINPSSLAKLFVIHFHGNACDIGQIAICAQREAMAYNAHYMIVEYPGYGLSNGIPNELVLNEVAKVVYDFVIHTLQVNYQQIVILGRSIGSGPATMLAGYLQSINMPIFALILHSPFASIADATSDLLGSSVSCCLWNRWENHYYLINHKAVPTTIQSPVLFIHADQDKIISVSHSKLLHEYRQKAGLRCQLFIQKSDDIYIKGHNFFDYDKDVVTPARLFLQNLVKEAESAAPGDAAGAGRVLPIIELSRDIVLQYTNAPSCYLPTGAVIDHSSNPNSKRHLVDDEGQKKPFCNVDECIGWTICPCVFTCECCTAGCYNLFKETTYQLSQCLCGKETTKSIPLEGEAVPDIAFHFQRLRPKDAELGSLSHLIFRNKSFVKKINEEDSAKALHASRTRQQQQQGHQTPSGNKQRGSLSSPSGGSNDTVVNPLLPSSRQNQNSDGSRSGAQSPTAAYKEGAVYTNNDREVIGEAVILSRSQISANASSGSTSPTTTSNRAKFNRSFSSVVTTTHPQTVPSEKGNDQEPSSSPKRDSEVELSDSTTTRPQRQLSDLEIEVEIENSSLLEFVPG